MHAVCATGAMCLCVLPWLEKGGQTISHPLREPLLVCFVHFARSHSPILQLVVACESLPCDELASSRKPLPRIPAVACGEPLNRVKPIERSHGYSPISCIGGFAW